MSTAVSRALGAGLFFLFVFLSGFWLSNSGKPYNGTILTVHKLISLAAAGFLAITIYQTNRVATLNGFELTAGVVTGLLFLGTIVTGGLLSTDKPLPAAVLTIHRRNPIPSTKPLARCQKRSLIV